MNWGVKTVPVFRDKQRRNIIGLLDTSRLKKIFIEHFLQAGHNLPGIVIACSVEEKQREKKNATMF